jgi:tetratricopeptide (TPR) repeat protein
MKRYQGWGVAFALGLTTLAYAADTKKERAKEIFVSAKERYDNKEYTEALAGFEELLRVSGSAAVYLNIAQCQRLMGQYEEAVLSYRKFLEGNPKTPHRAQIEEKVLEMEVALHRAREEARVAEAASKPVMVESTYASTSQPVVESISAWMLPQGTAQLLEEQMRSLEETTQDSVEIALRRTSRLRLVLPGGLALAGGALGVGAIALRASIEASGETTRKAQRTLAAMAIGSDVAFASAGVALLYVVRKNSSEEQYYVGVSPVQGGGGISIGLVR